MDSHYYICKLHNLEKCKECGRNHYTDIKHVCNPKMITYYSKKVMKKSEFVDMINCVSLNPMNYTYERQSSFQSIFQALPEIMDGRAV